MSISQSVLDKLTEEELGTIQDESYSLGYLRLDEIAKDFRSRARRVSFVAEFDTEAKFYRNLADEFQRRHDKERKEWENKYRESKIKESEGS